MRLVLAGVLVAVLAACGGADEASSDDGPGTTALTPSSSTAPPTTADEPEGVAGYYVSIGDSYAQGYQPGQGPEDGFAYQVPDLAREQGWDLELVNFGCGGATTTSLVESPGCRDGARAPGGPEYDGAQLDAAVAFAEEHPGEVAMVTVSIGGNDVTACVQAEDPVDCVAGAMGEVRDVLAPALVRLRAAVGPDAEILGLTYPDVILGAWVDGGEDLAQLSLVAFRDFINPTLADAYESVDGTFVDITAGTGAYEPLTETTTLEPYGEIPVAVARVCELTWFCERQDIHARSEGYLLMAELIVEALPDP